MHQMHDQIEYVLMPFRSPSNVPFDSSVTLTAIDRHRADGRVTSTKGSPMAGGTRNTLLVYPTLPLMGGFLRLTWERPPVVKYSLTGANYLPRGLPLV